MDNNDHKNTYNIFKFKFSLFCKNNKNSNIVFPPDDIHYDDIISHFIYDKINKICILNKNKPYLEFEDGNIIFKTFLPKDSWQFACQIIESYLAKFILADIFGELNSEFVNKSGLICRLIHNETNTCFDFCSFGNIFEPLNPFFEIITPYSNIETTPKSFTKDLLELLNFLCNYQHEYITKSNIYYKEKLKIRF